MRELGRRIFQNVLLSNTDDDLRNHGFLQAEPDDWRPAPAYDIDPVAVDVGPRVLATAIEPDDSTRHPSNYDALFGDHSNVLQSSATTPPATAASAAPPP